jgi:NAD(P)-dependent dehydrogenase (short-subunit alcohol dehydrogenase family)
MAFHGKAVFITGGGSGMGRLAAQRHADEGAEVVAVDVNEPGLAETAAGRGKIHTFRLDVTDGGAVDLLIREVEDRWGPVDRVYNAAAIMPTAFLVEQTAAQIARVMDVNYKGLVNVTMAVLPGMLRRRAGDILNFASIAGWVPSPHFGAYDASKFAVVAFTEVLAHENHGRGVRFACVCPPPVRTPLLDQAVSRPRVMFKFMRPMRPGRVLDEIEAGLERGDLFIFPGLGTSTMWRFRRFFPDLTWSVLRRIERV